MTFEHEYDLQALKLIQPQGQQFKMNVTPRFSWHYEQNEYEAYMARLLAKMCERASTFVDVGAHYGFFSLLAASRHSHLRVIAAEPVNENFKILTRSVKFNKLKNIQLLNVAISDSEGDKSFCISAASDNSSFYAHPAAPTLGTEQVKVTTIDGLLESAEPGPIVLKIDAGGHEFAVFEGMKQTLERFPDIALFVDFNPKMIEVAGRKPADLLQRLDDLGFSVFLLDDENQRHFRILPNTDWSTFFNPTGHANLVCLPKARAVSVLFFSHMSSLGGAERSLLELVDEWMTDHWALATIVSPNEGDLTKALRSLGASVAIVPFDWWCHPDQVPADSNMRMARSVRSIVRQQPLFRDIGPDLIWTQSIVIPWGAVTAALLRKPHIWSICEYGEQDHQLQFYLPFADVVRFVELSSNFIFANSPSLLRALFSELDSERADFIYRHIRVPDRKRLKRADAAWTKTGVTRIGAFGTLHSGKGQEDLVRAVGELASRGRQVELILAGLADQSYLDRLRSLTKGLGIESQVTFTGFIDDPYPTIATADIVVSCSRREAFGRSVVEAMLLERAVVYTGAGGYLDYMIDGKTGLAYPPGDAGKLAGRLEKLMGNPDLRKKLGQQARAQAEKLFSRAGYGEKAYKRAFELRDQPAHLLSSLGGKAEEIYAGFETLTSILCADVPESSPGFQESGAELAVARSRIVELEKAVEVWASQAKGLEHGIEVWSTQARNVETDRASISTRLAETQAALAEKAKEAAESKGALLAAQLHTHELEKSVEIWSTQARNVETERASIITRLAETQTALSEKAGEATDLKGALLIAQSRLRELENGVEIWSTQARNLETDRASISSRLAESQTALAEKAGEAAESKGALLIAQSRVQELEKGVEAWSTQASRLEVERIGLQSRAAQLEAALLVRSSESAQLNNELVLAHSRVRDLEQALERSGARARQLHDELEQRATHVVELELHAGQLRQQLNTRDGQMLTLQGQVQKIEHGIGVWSKQALALEAHRDILSAQLTEAESILAEKAREAIDSKVALSALESAVQDAQNRLRAANEELARLYKSRSWRLTAPLRALRRVPSKLRFAMRKRVVVGVHGPDQAPPIPVATRIPSHSTQSNFVPVPINEEPLYVAAPAQLIAFYLPQFHPIPENDRFWGKGFTEWTNVKRGTPQFAGHYQPRLPGDLGFYDLRQIEVQRRQVELAKRYGIGGFCFYVYWFNGQRLLEKPLEQYLANSELNLPFCLCWANENWTRAWDGRSKEVLIAQSHSPEDDLAFIQHLARYLEDPRYIRVKGKPLVIVYRPGLLPAPHETARRWRAWCREQGIGEIFLAYVQSFESVDPTNYGFDAAIEFPPNNMHCPPYSGEVELINPSYSGLIYDWEFFVRRSESFQKPPYTLFRGVCPSWDNEARRSGRGAVMFGSSPEGYRQWLKNALQDTVSRFDDPSERLVFINAWNEWAEGAYLEPDARYGYAYLQATRDAIEDVTIRAEPTEAAARSKSGILVVGHDAHPHGAQFLTLNIMRELRQVMGLDAECLLMRDGPLTSAYAEIGPVHELHGCNPQSPEAQKIVARLKARGFHTAICNTTVSGQFVPLLKSTGFKVVSLIHEMPHVLETYEGAGLKDQARSISAAADHIIFAGDFVADGFQQFAPFDAAKKINLTQGLYKRNRLRTPAEIARARSQLRERFGLAADTRVVLSVAFADHRKGIDLFVDIGERVLADLPRTAFIWVGKFDAAIKQEVTDRIARSRYSKHFIFPGFTADTDLFYAGADLYALTSREDPFPSVILEALDVGIPLVAFEGVGAFEKMIRSNDVGRLAPQFDTATFARQVKDLLEDDDQRAAMGRLGSNLIKRDFSFRKYVYDLLAIAKVPVKRTSVIVPNYNYRRYLEARLSSIDKQTVPPYEVIVIDDASSDGSYEWLQENLERVCPGAELLRNETNSGSVFNQWLAGVRRARGDYVWIAEADDLAEPDFLAETLLKFDNPDVVMSFCQSKQMDSDSNILCDHYLDYVKDVSPTKWTESYVNNGLDEIVTALSVKNTIPNVSAVVFKRETLLAALESKLAELKQFKVAGDWVTYIEVLQNGNIAFSPNPLNLHRRHQSSVTIGSFNLSQLREIMSVQEKVREGFNPPDDVVNKAASYSEKLFEQFGLASSETPSIYQHPELSRFLSETDSAS